MKRDFSQKRLERLLQIECTVLRHDVDVSLDAAEKMAVLENRLGVRSTYYLMTHSPFYPPAAAFTCSLYLRELGHQVGWHIDARRSDPFAIAQESPGALVSFHCPRPSELWRRFEGIRSAYEPQWKGRYYADSRGRFSHGDPEDSLAEGLLQINLHPEWWFEPNWYQRVPDSIYEDFFHEPKSKLWT